MKRLAEKSKDVSGGEGARAMRKKPSHGQKLNKVERERERGRVPVISFTFLGSRSHTSPVTENYPS